MQKTLSTAVASARKLYGDDIEMLVARCPAWGNDDCCVLVYGKRHAEAAGAFALVVKGARIEQQSTAAWRSIPAHTYSAVSFPALATA